MTRFSFRVYPGRGHAIGFGGNGAGSRGGMGGRSKVHIDHDEELSERIEAATQIKTPRDRFIDQILAKIELRKALVSANAQDIQAGNDSREERQHKRQAA